jgi:glycosyltransferase involved in cell wall biosynthesis
MSRIAPKKRIDLCIEAVEVLANMDISAHLTIAGNGDAKLVRELQELVQSKRLNHSVDFIGQVQGDAKTQSFLAADVFLLPSDDENFGIGLAEALAHGLPCIASQNVAAAMAIQGRSGIVLASPTGTSIAQAVVELASGDVGRSQSDARAAAESSFSWDAVSDQWMQALISTYETEGTSALMT